MKTILAAATALVFCSSVFAEKDFFGLPTTPAPATPKPATKPGSTTVSPGEAAGSRETNASADLVALQQRYRQEVATATKATRERYAAALESLLRSFIQKNDLAGALSVKNELASFNGTAAPVSDNQSPVQEKESKPPPEFTALQQRYDQDIVAWSKPARDRYVVGLQLLLRSTMQKGDLPTATTIEAELAAAKGSPLNERDEMKKKLLTSSWWQIRDVILEFTPDGKLIEHSSNPQAWKGKSWKLSADGKSVECTYANGQTQSYSFKNGGLVHFDPSWGEFKMVPKK